MAKSEIRAASVAASTEVAQEPAAIANVEAEASVAASTEVAQEPVAIADVEAPISHPRLSVRSSLEHRRRAGIAFGQAPTTIEPNTLTREQADAVAADPFLTIGPAPAD